MARPGLAPCTPASHDPSVLVVPSVSYAVVASPRYQTLPRSSWANQSYVSSLSLPSSVARSWTTVARMPSTSRVSGRTVTVICSVPSELVPR
jgi:hypothetical protein